MVSSFWENLSYIWNYCWSLLRKQEQNPWECSFIKRSVQSFRAYKGDWRKEWHSFQMKTSRKHNQLGPPSLNKIQSTLLLEWLKLVEKDNKGLARAFDLIPRHTSTLFSRSPWSNTVYMSLSWLPEETLLQGHNGANQVTILKGASLCSYLFP